LEHRTEALGYEEARQGALVEASGDEVLDDLSRGQERVAGVAGARLGLGHESGVDEMLDQSRCHT
jgi:hypothetical protein